ncbi:MAG: DUF3418 domain-containing protein, partial [Nocardiopsaceae bacterium]|nr:DUF3418 domain-containing protein [Nocardiopsaceae bacterium]
WEWQDLTAQLRQAARETGVVPERDSRRRSRGSISVPNDHGSRGRAARQHGPRAMSGPADGGTGGTAAGPEPAIPAELAERIHLSLLAGLLSHIGMRDQRPAQRGKRRGPAEFLGARGTRFAIFPDSVLARKPPPWVVTAELVETSRLWGRVAAQIQPEWAESLAGHLVRRSYSEPHWDSRRGAAMASEKVLLYGLPLVAARPVGYGRIDPVAARELFIQHALVEGDWETHHRFFRQNQQLLDEAAEVERRARRRGIVADDDALYSFYDQRIPASVISSRHFDQWWKQARAAGPDLLTLSPADLAGPAADEVRPEDYPVSWAGYPLSYEFAPGEADDGVTVDIPLTALNQASADEFGWQVPGRRQELVTELIRSLPKQLRRAFVPAPDVAAAVLTRLGQPHGDLLAALAAELSRTGGVSVPRDAFDLSRLPAHLRITFRVTEDGREVATGKDLGELRARLAPRLRAALAEAADAAGGITRTGLRDWDGLGTLPRVFTDGQARGYPALADAGDSADVRLLPTEAEANESMRLGTRRLILLQVPSGGVAAARSVASRLPAATKLAMSRAPYPGAAALLADCAACAADQVIADAGGPAWDEAGFGRLLAAARESLDSVTTRVVGVAGQVLLAAQQAETRLSQAASPVLAPAVEDLRAQLAGLVYPGFIAETGARRLPDLVRYLRAIGLRLDKAAENPGRDAERMADVHRVADAYQQVTGALPAAVRSGPSARSVRWLIEEFRVSLFAQSLGTPVPVSEKRILTALDRLPGA